MKLIDQESVAKTNETTISCQSYFKRFIFICNDVWSDCIRRIILSGFNTRDWHI